MQRTRFPIKKKIRRTYFFVYVTTNLINGMIYVGAHKTHNLNDGYLGSGMRFRYAINKYGKANFERVILERCFSLSETLKKEICWILKLNALDKKIGYNLDKGGGGGYGKGLLGRCCSDETKAKISKARLGKPVIYKDPEKTRKVKSEAMIKMWKDPIQKKRLEGKHHPWYNRRMYKEDNLFYKKKHTDKSKRQMSKAHKAYWKTEEGKETKKRFSIFHKQQIPWNKGLTKETDDRVKRNAKACKKQKRLNFLNRNSTIKRTK